MTSPDITRSTDDLLWRAGADLISHASLPREPRTLCGKPVVLERLAWPRPQRRCNACVSEAPTCRR